MTIRDLLSARRADAGDIRKEIVVSLTPSRHLPERPSLEQLRKQARERFVTLRAGDPAVKLAAAQHALAREYGFESWPKRDPMKAISAGLRSHVVLTNNEVDSAARP
jgi:hypothetical protein